MILESFTSLTHHDSDTGTTLKVGSVTGHGFLSSGWRLLPSAIHCIQELTFEGHLPPTEHVIELNTKFLCVFKIKQEEKLLVWGEYLGP